MKLGKIFRTIRIQTLGCALAPVLCSGWLAYQEFGFCQWWIWVMTGFFAVNLQIAANCFDDHFDEGIHLTLALVSLGLAVSTAAVTIFLTQTWVLLPFGLLCILSLLFYSGGPRPLGDSGWGEALVFLFFGPICGCGSFYIFTKQFDWRIIAMSLVLGLVIVGLLVFNHFEDFLKDLKAGRSTVATRRILKQLSQLEQEKIKKSSNFSKNSKKGANLSIADLKIEKDPSIHPSILNTAEFSNQSSKFGSATNTSAANTSDTKTSTDAPTEAATNSFENIGAATTTSTINISAASTSANNTSSATATAKPTSSELSNIPAEIRKRIVRITGINWKAIFIGCGIAIWVSPIVFAIVVSWL